MDPAIRTSARRERSVMTRLARGNASAIADLYARHGRLVYAIACRCAGPQQAEDITRAVFIHLWNSRGAGVNPAKGVRVALAVHTYELAHSRRPDS